MNRLFPLTACFCLDVDEPWLEGLVLGAFECEAVADAPHADTALLQSQPAGLVSYTVNHGSWTRSPTPLDVQTSRRIGKVDRSLYGAG